LTSNISTRNDEAGMKYLHVVVLIVTTLVWGSGAWADGFDARYDAYVGDLDQDGDQDIYIRERVPVVMVPFDDFQIPIARPPKVQSFALLQGPGGSISLSLSTANLSIGQAQRTSAVEVIPVDVDLDGNLDGIVKGLGNVIPGATEQIVFASSGTGVRNSPAGLKALDAATKSFISQVAGWSRNNSYFELTALQNGWYTRQESQPFAAWWKADYLGFWGFTVGGQRLVQDNEDPYVRASVPASCNWGTISCRFSGLVWEMWVSAVQITITYNYSNFDSRARSVGNSLLPAEQNDELVAGSAEAQNVATIFQQVFGRPVLGNVLVSGGRLDYELGPDESRGKVRLAALQNMVIALQAAVTQPTQQPPAMKKLPGVTVVENRVAVLEQGALTDVNGIVLHRTGGTTVDGALRSAKTERTGTHFYVAKDGTIHQAASLDKYTHHVGKLKSKCQQEPTTCTAVERQDANAVSGVKNLHNHEAKKAYPARYPKNDDAVGIEVVADYNDQTKTYEAATPEQLQAVQALVEALKSEYGLSNSDVYHHDKISYKEGVGEGAGLGY
jgi:N-acetyl-anhydromuramyl-L-alanine amidase AmpD